MTYLKNPYCPLNNDCMCPNTGNQGGNNNNNNNNNNNDNNNCNGNNNGNNQGNKKNCYEMYNQIAELEFALTDLNLYLDTHPNDKEALEMFTKLSATLKSIMYDYARECEALKVQYVPNRVPFEWAANIWPWQE